MSRRILWVAIFAAYFVLIVTPAAQAYLDPGSGSFIFQVIIGGLLGAAVAVKAFWQRIWGFLAQRKADREVEDKVSEEIG